MVGGPGWPVKRQIGSKATILAVPGTDDSQAGLLRSCARFPDAADLDQLRHQAAQLNWTGFPDRAEAHGLAPLAHLHLTRAGVSPPVDVQQRLLNVGMETPPLYAPAEVAEFVRDDVARWTQLVEAVGLEKLREGAQ